MQHAGRSLYIYGGPPSSRLLSAGAPGITYISAEGGLPSQSRGMATLPSRPPRRRVCAEGYGRGLPHRLRQGSQVSLSQTQPAVHPRAPRGGGRLPGARGPAAPRGLSAGSGCPRRASQPHRCHSETQPPRQVAPHCRLDISGGRECECWPGQSTVLYQIYLSRHGRPDHQPAGRRHPAGEIRPQGRIQDRTGPPGGPRHAVEEYPVCRHGVAIWVALCAKDLFCGSGWPDVDYALQRRSTIPALAG